MKRLLVGFGLGTALVYGWRRLLGAEAEPEPSWQGTDNDPEDRAAIQDDLLGRTRDSIPFDYEREPAKETEESETSEASEASEAGTARKSTRRS